MNLKNLVALTTAALLTGEAAASNVYAWNAASHAPKKAAVALDVQDLSACIANFKNNQQWPIGGVLNTSMGFSKAKKLFDNVTSEGLASFVKGADKSGALQKLAKRLSKTDVAKIVSLYDHTAAIDCGTNASTAKTCGNQAVAFLLLYSKPSHWPANVHPTLADAVLSSPPEHNVTQLRQMNPAFVKEHRALVMKYLSTYEPLVLTTKSILSVLVKDDAACAEMTPAGFLAVVRDPAAAKYIDGKVFPHLSGAIRGSPQLALYARFLPDNVFENLVTYVDPRFQRFATVEQTSKWCTKSYKDANVPLQFHPVISTGKQAAVVNTKVYQRFFEDASSSAGAQAGFLAATENWLFWKHLPTKVFKDLVRDVDIAKLIPKSAYRFMTKEQRQILLDAGNNTNNETTCASLPTTIFKGKKKRTAGLTVSKDCFEARNASGKWLFSALLLDAVSGSYGGLVESGAVPAFRVQIVRGKKVNADGKSVKQPDLVLNGFLAMEALQGLQNGPEFVKSFLAHKDDDILEQACKVDAREFRKTKWLQTVITERCLKWIDIELDDAKKMHPNVWANMSKDQVKGLGGRTELRDLEGPFMEGLAANKYFAAMSCKKRTKDNRDGDEVIRESLLALIKPSQRSKYFGAAYVAALPQDADCQVTLAAHVASLSDDAMAKVTGSYVNKHKAVLDALRPEQYARISEGLDADCFPATLSSSQVTSMSSDRVAALTGKFLSHMSASNIAHFSAEQVKLLQADALRGLCGDKATAIKHELSESQKEALGKDCPASAPAADSMAPTNAHLGAFTAAAALAAGSMAILL